MVISIETWRMTRQRQIAKQLAARIAAGLKQGAVWTGDVRLPKTASKLKQKELMEVLQEISREALHQWAVEMGRKGGTARAAKYTAEERSEIAKQARKQIPKAERKRIAKLAAAARWAKERQSDK